MATKKITLNELRSIVKQIVKENMLGSESQMEVFSIIEFLEKNKMDIVDAYQNEKNENNEANIWKIMAHLYLNYNRQFSKYKQ